MTECSRDSIKPQDSTEPIVTSISNVCVAEKNLNDILMLVVNHMAPRRAVVVFDLACELAQTLTQAYKRCLPEAQFIDFSKNTPEAVLAVFADLVASDLVILVQSTNFRLASCERCC